MDKTAKKSIRKRNISRIKRQSRWRLYAAMFIVFVLIICAAGRIIYLNVNKGTEYKKEVLAQQSYVNKVIPYKRGDIVDKNGNTLAKSTKVYDLIIEPKRILDADKDKKSDDYKKATAAALEKIFGIKESTFYKILSKKPDSMYYPMKKYTQLSRKIVEQFKELSKDNSKIIGVWFEEKYLRTYPYSQVASTVLGFCSSDGQGLGGIESWYNSSLNGVNGKSFGYYDSNLNLVEEVKEAQNGNTVVSTIDINVQGVLEKKMKKFQEETGSENMGVILMNPQNGEIYAMADYPSYDLNNPRDLSKIYSKKELTKLSSKEKGDLLQSLWRNFCISDAYEPGSTFKPITVAASFDEGASYDGKHYFCDGGQQIGTTYIKCVAHTIGGHKNTDPCKALMKSCNDVMMQMAADLGVNKFTKYVRSFGFGAKTGIDLPGEAVGGIFSKEDMHQVELATSSFGQGQTVTMIQLISAFCATINGGNYYQPHIVKEIDSQNGAVVSSNNNVLVKRVISEDTSKFIRKYLEKTVEDDEGTASPARVKGYVIGGKTGTAEKHPITKKKYLVSFAGFTPVDKPELAIYVVIDEPHVKDQAHSTYATEFASEVLKDVLPMLGIYKESGKSSDAKAVTIPSTKKGNSILEVPAGGYTISDYGVAKSKKNANN